MPINRRRTTNVINLPKNVTKVARKHRATRNVRFVQVEQKGHTEQFAELVDKRSDLQSKQLADPFNYILSTFIPIAGLAPIMPMYSFYLLAKLAQQSNILRQCIESYVINIESYGHVLEYIGPEGQENLPRVQAEKVALENFLSSCSPDLSLKEIRERSRWDMEEIGQRFFEVSRDQTGRIVMFDHVPAITMFRTRREQEPTQITIEVPNPADPTQIVRKTANRNFCRFIQMIFGPTGWRRVFFKEFGDPRSISPITGEVDESLPIEEQATEILMLNLYTPGYVYGLPRWIGQLPSILGSREAEMVNLNFFRENAIPAMAVLISGGALTDESFKVIEDYLNALRGQRAMQRILVLEASGDDTSGSTDHSVSAPKIDMKPMISERQQDGLFKDYDENNRHKIMSSFRLPPVFLGFTLDYNRATSNSAVITAEQQVFYPERYGFDSIMNSKILVTYRPRYWRYKSGGPPIVDQATLTRTIDALDNSGALTPNAVIKIANRILDIEIKPVVEKWGDIPFPATMNYINQGRTIEGLTEFIIDLKALAAEQDAQNQAAANTLNNKKKPPGKDKNNLKVIKEIVRKELGQIAEDLENAVLEKMQTSAS